MRLVPAVAAGALIVLWGFLSSRLPALPIKADIMLSSALVLALVAVVSAAVDVVSVAAGPTKAILGQGPVVVGYFTIGVTWAGYTYKEAFTGLGISDVIFLALYLGAARRFGLRVGWSAVAMVVSFLATIAVAMWWTALPALPLLSVAFLAVNGDLLWQKLRRGGGPAGEA